MRIEAVSQITPELVDAVGTLLPQLGGHTRQPTAADLQAVIDAPGNTLLVARDDADRVQGMLTLVVYPMPSHILSYIDDVVVDSAARRQGAGAALVTAAVRLARAAGAAQTDLLSHDRRAAAISMYQRLGFERFETNVFRLVHEPVPGP